MADIKISQLGAAASISDSDVIPMTASGVTVKASAALLKEYAIGDTNISSLGDGSPTGAIDALNTSKVAKTDIAPIESSVATQDHAVGAEFYLSGVLMKATAAIAQGDQIVNGTNCAPANPISSEIQTLSNKANNKVLYLTSVACAATTGNFASVSNAAITADHVLAECVFASSSAITTDVTWTSAAGSLTLNGTCASATTANIVLVKKDN